MEEAKEAEEAWTATVRVATAKAFGTSHQLPITDHQSLITVVGQFELLAPLIWRSSCAKLTSIMPKRSRKDVNVTAFNIVAQATGSKPRKARKPRKNPHAVALGRKGGLKGGVARAERLSPEQRRQIAQAAAQARWSKKTS